MSARETIYEIKLNHGLWVRVSYEIFRSWSGERKQDGEPYHGVVYYLGSSKIARKPLPTFNAERRSYHAPRHRRI